MAAQALQASRAQAVTPSDSTNIPTQVEGDNIGCLLYVGEAGDVAVETVGGDTVTFVGLLGGSFIPVHVRKVLSTGTTADSILAIW